MKMPLSWMSLQSSVKIKMKLFLNHILSSKMEGKQHCVWVGGWVGECVCACVHVCVCFQFCLVLNKISYTSPHPHLILDIIWIF